MKIATLTAAATLAAFSLTAEVAPKPAEAAPKAPAAQREKLPGPMMRGPGAMMQDPIVRAVSNPKIAEKIGLTPEQKAKLGDAAASRAANRELQEKIRKAVERQMELLRAEKIDEAAVMAAIDETFEARKELAKEQTRRLIAVKSILTPEQIKMIREEMKANRPGAKRKPPKEAAKEPKDPAKEAK